MWRHSLKDWEKVEIEVYKQCYYLAEKKFESVLDESEKITNRVYTFIGILISIVTICVGFIVNQRREPVQKDFVFYLSVTGISIVAVCLLFLVRLINSRESWRPGTQPRDILLSHYIEMNNLDPGETEKYIYLTELERIQDKIERCDDQNGKRISIFTNCLITIIGTAIIAIMAIIIQGIA